MQNKQLRPGDTAPQFTAHNVCGPDVRLQDYKNTYTLVVFLRYAACPWCNLTIHRLALEQERLKKAGCEIIAFVQSEPEGIIDNVYKQHEHTPQFPIIADSKREHYDQYYIRDSKAATLRSVADIPFWVKSITKGFAQKKVDGDLFLVPASFLIGPGEQKILSAHYSTSFYDHIVFEEIYSYLYAPAAA